MNNFLVKKILKESYSFLFDNIITIVKKIWLAMLFFISGSLIYHLLLEFKILHSETLENVLKLSMQGKVLDIHLLVFIISTLIIAVFAFMIVTYIMGAKLKNDFSEPGILGVDWNDKVSNVAFASVILGMIFIVAMLTLWPIVRIEAAGYGVPYIAVLLLTVLSFIGLFGGAYLYARLILFIPDCLMHSTVSKESMLKSWKLTHGKVIDIISIIVGMTLPIFIISGILKMFILLIFNAIGLDALALLICSLIVAVTQLLVVMALSVSMATIYQHMGDAK